MTAAEKYDDNKQQAQKLQDLIDGFFPDKMRELEREENALKVQIAEAFNAQKSIKALERELSEHIQEHSTLIKECNARQELQGPSDRHHSLSVEKQRLDRLKSSPFQSLEPWLNNLYKTSSDQMELFKNNPTIEQGLPHANELIQAEIFVNELIAETAKNMAAWLSSFDARLNQYIATEPWPTIVSQLNLADYEFEAKLAEKGLKKEDISHLQALLESRKKLETTLEQKKQLINEKRKSAPSINELMSRLHSIWQQQFHLRKKAVAMANQHTSGGERSYKIIEVIAEYQDDNKDFLEHWDKLSPDKRSKLGIAWIDIGNRIFADFRQDRTNPESENPQSGCQSPWQLIQTAIDANDTSTLSRWIGRPDQELPETFISHFSMLGDRWEQILYSRVKDSIDLTLFRADSTEAGMISNSTLSDGQRNTAALVLLLSQAETGPLIIDQPEEELDSEFIYNELLPLLRANKNKRQLIFATHNANLPVNGDSELVYAFEARANKGKCLAQGGLDNKSVADAVLKVMEGSAEAFQRRKNKYHF